MKVLHLIAAALVVVGAVNWGLVALAELDLVAFVFGLQFGETAVITRIVYGLVGLAGLYHAVRLLSARQTEAAPPDRTRRRAVGVLGATALLLLVVAAPALAEDEGTVTVVHGVPDLTVDVYVNDDLTLEDFEPGTITDPLTLPAGDYDLAVRPAGADPSSDPAIADTATLPAGANVSIVAHLDADAAPTLSVFVNDVEAVGAGEARLTVRHTAAAPTVDILADGTALVSGLANPDERTAEVPAGTYEVAVAPEGTTDPVLGPTDLPLDEGTGSIVYAIGAVDDDSLDLLVQTVSGLHSNPDGVPAGTAGLASDSVPMMWLFILSAAGVAIAVAGGTRLARARS